MRRFYLDNVEAGARVGEGCCFSDGTVGLRLLGKSPPMIFHQTVEAMLHRHALPPESVRWVDEAT